MAKIGVFSGKQRKWYPFDEDTEILIEFLTKDRIVELQKKGAKQAKLSSGDVDVITNRMIGEAAVHGWRHTKNHSHPGLLDADGNAIAFTAENRDMLMKCCREFSNFVNEIAIDSRGFLEDDEPAAGEEIAAAKND